MSIPVDIRALPDQISRFDPFALLISAAGDGPPHVSSVVVSVEGDRLVMGAGRTTRANATANPAVAIVWPNGPTQEYCLIVDAVAEAAASDAFVVRPTSAVLHRVAGLRDSS